MIKLINKFVDSVWYGASLFLLTVGGAAVIIVVGITR